MFGKAGQRINDRSANLARSWLKRATPYLFVAPAVLMITFLALYPTVRAAQMSISEVNRTTREVSFAGLANFVAVLVNPAFGDTVAHTLAFSIGSTFGHLILAFVLALAMNAALNRTFLTICRAFFLLPWALSPIVVALITNLWSYPLISPLGRLFTLMGSNAEFAPLASTRWSLLTLTLVNIWHFTPFFMLMILAALQSVDAELYDAAMVDGAGFLQRIRYVTIPHIRGTLLTLTLFDLVITATYFDLIWATTKGGPVRSTDVLSTFTYRLSFYSMEWNMAAATGLLLLVFCVVLSGVVVAMMQRE